MIYKGLERYLVNHKITMSNLADRCGVSRTCMFNICKGNTLPNKYTIDKILKVTGMSYEECFFGGIEMNYDKLITGKKLSDAMNFFDEETIFHVGAEISFFFVGTKSEFEKDKLMISNKYIDRHRDLIERNQKRIRKEVSRITDQNASKKIIKDCICNLRRFNNAIDKSENYIKTFVPFESRKVIKIYERSQKDGIVMIVEGNEVGGFWDKDEYERGAAL